VCSVKIKSTPERVPKRTAGWERNETTTTQPATDREYLSLRSRSVAVYSVVFVVSCNPAIRPAPAKGLTKGGHQDERDTQTAGDRKGLLLLASVPFLLLTAPLPCVPSLLRNPPLHTYNWLHRDRRAKGMGR
jgi:hypothetical protein